MHRISRDNPVRRRLFPVDNLTDQARLDNFTNILQESTTRDRIEKMRKWNFDFENEVPLEGTYTWFPCNGDNDWLGVDSEKLACEDIIKATDQGNFLPMKFENELTPKIDKEDNVPILRKRRKENVDNALVGDRSVKRRISFD